MGQATDLLLSTAGEEPLGSAIGRWRQLISQLVDDGSDPFPDGLSYADGRAQTAFVLLTTPSSALTVVYRHLTLVDGNYLGCANFSARGGAQAFLSRRRVFSVTSGVISALTSLSTIDQDYNPGNVTVDIAPANPAGVAQIDFNATGLLATPINWVLEWSVTRF